jgi:hypothetical protein
MGSVQGQDGGAVAGLELQGVVASVLEPGDLGWHVHGPDYPISGS